MIENNEEYEFKMHRIFELELTGDFGKEYEILFNEIKTFEENDLLTPKEREEIENG